MNTSSSFIKGKIFPRSKLYPNQIFPHTNNLCKEKFDWLFIVDPIWLVWNTYISHSLTDSLTDSLTHSSTTHNILDVPTKRYFFLQKNNSKIKKKNIIHRHCTLWRKQKYFLTNSFVQSSIRDLDWFAHVCDTLRISEQLICVHVHICNTFRTFLHNNLVFWAWY